MTSRTNPTNHVRTSDDPADKHRHHPGRKLPGSVESETAQPVTPRHHRARHLTGKREPCPRVVVETLARPDMSVVSFGGEPREFASLSRMAQKVLRAEHPDDPAILALIDGIRRTRDTGKSDTYSLGNDRSGRRIGVIDPVPGPQGSVYGVQYWVGNEHVEPPPPRRVAGISWNLRKQVVQRADGVELSLAELFECSPNFDGQCDMLSLLYEPARDRLRAVGTCLDSGGNVMRWQAAIRSIRTPRLLGARCLFEALDCKEPDPLRPTLRQTVYRECGRDSDSAIGVIVGNNDDVPTVAVWMGDPPSWLRWQGGASPEGLIHPEDRARLAAATPPGIEIIRCLNSEGQYVLTAVELMQYPGRNARRMMIGKFKPVDDRQSTNSIDLEPAGRMTMSANY